MTVESTPVSSSPHSGLRHITPARAARPIRQSALLRIAQSWPPSFAQQSQTVTGGQYDRNPYNSSTSRGERRSWCSSVPQVRKRLDTGGNTQTPEEAESCDSTEGSLAPLSMAGQARLRSQLVPAPHCIVGVKGGLRSFGHTASAQSLGLIHMQRTIS